MLRRILYRQGTSKTKCTQRVVLREEAMDYHLRWANLRIAEGSQCLRLMLFSLVIRLLSKQIKTINPLLKLRYKTQTNRHRPKADLTLLPSRTGQRTKRLLLTANPKLLITKAITLVVLELILLLEHLAQEDITLYLCRMIHVLLATGIYVTD